MAAIFKKDVLESLVREGLADSVEEVEIMLVDMGITWKDVRDGKWF